MRLIGLAVILTLSLLAAPQAAATQSTGKVYRIGFLHFGSPTTSRPLIEAFSEGLRELGWVEGKTMVIEYRSAESRFDRLPNLAAELVRLKVDVILAGSTAVAAAAMNATGTIPIVMASASDPVGLGLVASLAAPGGNITGLSFSVGVETYGKSLELLREAAPKIRLVAILSNPTNPSHALATTNVTAAARSLGVQLQLLEARAPNLFDSAFAAMVKERVQALLVVADGMFASNRTRLADLAAKSRLPSMYGVREHVEAGGLMSYGPSVPAQFRRAALYVDRILKGTKPSDLPVEQPTKFELVINLKTAKALGLTIPPSVLGRADEVIQ